MVGQKERKRAKKKYAVVRRTREHIRFGASSVIVHFIPHVHEESLSVTVVPARQVLPRAYEAMLCWICATDCVAVNGVRRLFPYARQTPPWLPQLSLAALVT